MEIGQNLLNIISIAILLVFSAFFSGSETAFFSLTRSAIHALKEKGARGQFVADLLERPRALLVTILFGNLLVNIASTSIVTAIAVRLLGGRGIGVAVLIMTFLILIFGEILPKSVALRYSSSFAIASAPVFRVLMIVFYPFREILGKIADYMVNRSREFFGDMETRHDAVELATAVETAYKDGIFDEFEKEILTNLLLFTETTVREILVPRGDVFMLDVETPFKEAVKLVKENGFSRVPVFENTRDNIIGILLAKDMLKYSRMERVSLRNIIRPPIFVPDTKNIKDLFGELINARQHLVIVIDEHGAFEGIITIEDILEEIFGEIRDRREPNVEEYMIVDEDHIVVEGDMRIEDFNKVFETDFESEEAETIAGFLIERVGEIPKEGFSFEIDGYRFLVISATKTKVEKLKIERKIKGRSK